jgi:ubiquinone/menaquinone biosynthesis C-methylase UbiE
LYTRTLRRTLRVFFSLLYHQFAWSYDFVAALVSLGKWQEWVSTVVPELPGPNILELGHGPGHLQVKLGGLGVRQIGIDESVQMGTFARKRLIKTLGTATLARAKAQSLPFPNSHFHQVTATFPSEYILDPNTLSEVHRVLVQGGKLVVILAAWITGRGLLERAAAWLFRVTEQAPVWVDENLEPFSKAGFQLNLKHIVKPSWTLFIILAEKSG